MSIILRALREARSMIETERAAFIDCHTLRNRGLEPDDQAIRQKYDDVLALIRDAIAAAEGTEKLAAPPQSCCVVAGYVHTRDGDRFTVRPLNDGIDTSST